MHGQVEMAPSRAFNIKLGETVYGLACKIGKGDIREITTGLSLMPNLVNRSSAESILNVQNVIAKGDIGSSGIDINRYSGG